MRAIFYLFLFAYAVVTACSFSGAFWWGFELLSHFRVQMAAAGLLGLALTLLAGRWRAAVFLLLLGGVNLAPVIPYLPPVQAAIAEVPKESRHDARILIANLHAGNDEPERLLLQLQQSRPDMVLLTEVSPRMDRRLSALLPGYRIERIGRAPSLFNLVLLHRGAVSDVEADYRFGDRFPSLRARFCPGKQRLDCLDFFGLHAMRPLGGQESLLRDEQLRDAGYWALSRSASANGTPVVLMGDLNLTPWAPMHDWLEDFAGLRNAGREQGLWQSWLSQIPGLGLWIDHVLVSDAVRVEHYQVGGEIGSDHYPVLVDLSWEERSR